MRKYKTSENVPDNLCYGVLNTTEPISRYTGQYQGQWAIFTPTGWMSDHVDDVMISLTLPQAMLVQQ